MNTVRNMPYFTHKPTQPFIWQLKNSEQIPRLMNTFEKSHECKPHHLAEFRTPYHQGRTESHCQPKIRTAQCHKKHQKPILRPKIKQSTETVVEYNPRLAQNLPVNSTYIWGSGVSNTTSSRMLSENFHPFKILSTCH